MVCIILGILAGCMLLLFSGSTDKARATKIASELEAVKQAPLTVESQRRTRNEDPLTDLTGDANKVAFTAAVNAILEKPLPGDRKALLLRDSVSRRRSVAFEFQADQGLMAALDKLVAQREGDGYSGNGSGTNYTLTLLLK